MITSLLLWSMAWAAPETTTLGNGVRLVVDNTANGTGWVEVGWFSAAGSAHLAPSSAGVALSALSQGTHSVRRADVVPRWAETTGTLPEPHLCATDAGAVAHVPASALAAWAWLSSDALADPVIADLDDARQRAESLFDPRLAFPGDNASSPWSWGASDAAASVSEELVRTHLRHFRDPSGLVVTVRGDVSLSQAKSSVGPAFARLPAVNADLTRAPATPRSASTTTRTRYDAPEQVVIRADIEAGPAARALVTWLNARVGQALDQVAFDATVSLREDAPIWTLQLTASPTPGRPQTVAPTWQAWLQEVAGQGISDTAPARFTPPSALQLAHDTLRPPIAAGPASPADMQRVLAEVAMAPRYIAIHTRPAEDPELDALRTELGEMTAELVRIRLRTVAETSRRDLPALIANLERERARVAPRLRPALDLVIRRAKERSR